MSDTTISGDRQTAADVDDELIIDVSGLDPEVAPPPGTPVKAIIGRSPGQLAWLRLRRGKTAVGSVITLVVLAVLAIGAPVISAIYGQNATANNPRLLDNFGYPLGTNGGMSSTHWLGLEPGVGRDILMQLLFGMRTSLWIAFVSASLTIALGVTVGIVAGYAGGIVDSALNWFTDFILAFPFLIFSLAAIPIIINRVYGNNPDISPIFRIGVLIAIISFFGWPYTARIIRGQVLSLREREFVEAARASGAGFAHILFRQLLPNLWAPILVVFSLAVPTYITAEAALSFLNIGVVEPTPDLGRMIYKSIGYIVNDPWYTFIPGLTILFLVLAFNLLGDSLRDALDPKSSR